MSDDNPSSSPDIDPKLLALREYLAMSEWNFSIGDGSFDDQSEGACILVGVDPHGSTLSDSPPRAYGPKFLPGGQKYVWGNIPLVSSDAPHLRECFTELTWRIGRLGLRGLVKPRVAIDAADRHFPPPWIRIAKRDIECAKYLPPRLITDDYVLERLRSQRSSKAGKIRASKDETTRLLNEPCYQEFLRLRDLGFPGCLFRSSGRPNARAITDKIYQRVFHSTEFSTHQAIPELNSLRDRVLAWLSQPKK